MIKLSFKDGDFVEYTFNTKLFDFEQCDFSNVSDEQLACDGVIHKCSIDVNDKGIEGAAVTVMPMAGNRNEIQELCSGIS